MVKHIDNAKIDSTVVNRPTILVELVGPAGAGKTTLFYALRRRSRCLKAIDPPFYKKLVDSSFFFKHCFLALPTFLRLYKNKNNDKFLSRQEITWILILNGWHHLLRRGNANDRKVIVLEHGPVFMMAHLYQFGPKCLRSQSANKWWKDMYNQWATTLNILVWLDTSNERIIERIRSRDEWHRMKDKPALEVFDFLAHYRAGYEKLISMLTSNPNGPKLLRFDTGQEPLDRIVNKLLVKFCLKVENGKDMNYFHTEQV